MRPDRAVPAAHSEVLHQRPDVALVPVHESAKPVDAATTLPETAP